MGNPLITKRERLSIEANAYLAAASGRIDRTMQATTIDAQLKFIDEALALLHEAKHRVELAAPAHEQPQQDPA